MSKIKKETLTKPITETKNKGHSPKKKKNGDKKSSDELSRKFGYVFPQSIRQIAESVGIAGLSDEVANSLAEDVSYRLRSIVQICAKHLKHSRHTRLTCEDVNEVLQMCDAPPVLGHGVESAPHNFIHIREPTIYILDDPIVDLASYALSEIYVPVKSTVTVSGKWAAIDEQRVKIKCEDIKVEPAEITNNKQFANTHIKIENIDNHKTDHFESEPRIAKNLIKYYGITCNSILGQNDLKVVLRDLSSNGKIVPIIPYLLNFITITLNKLNSERNLFRLLHSVNALTENKKIDFSPYYPVVRVANALLKIIKTVALEKKKEINTTNFPSLNDRSIAAQKAIQSYTHPLRCRAAQVLGKVLLRWCCSEDQRNSYILEMCKLIQDLHIPAVIHIGAIALLNELGPDALCAGLWPFLDQFLPYLRVVRQDKRALELAILNAAEILYRNPHFDNTGINPSPLLDQQLYDYFGDALCCRRLQLTENPQFLQKFLHLSSAPFDHKPEVVLKRTWRLPKCRNSIYNPESKRPTIHTAFHLPVIKRKRNPRIIFKFAGAIPVPEMSLRRRRLDSRYSQFIAGKVSEGHVVLVGKMCRKLPQKSFPLGSASLFSIL